MARSDCVPEWWTLAAFSPSGPSSLSKAAKRRIRRNKLPENITYSKACMLQHLPKMGPRDNDFRIPVQYIVIEIPVYVNDRQHDGRNPAQLYDEDPQVFAPSEYHYGADQLLEYLHTSGHDQGFAYEPLDSHWRGAYTGFMSCEALYNGAEVPSCFGEDLPSYAGSSCDVVAMAEIQATPISIYSSLDFSVYDNKSANHGAYADDMSCNPINDQCLSHGSIIPDDGKDCQDHVHEINVGRMALHASSISLCEQDYKLCLACLQPLSEYCCDFHGLYTLPQGGSSQAPGEALLQHDSAVIGLGPGPWAGKFVLDNTDVPLYTSPGLACSGTTKVPEMPTRTHVSELCGSTDLCNDASPLVNFGEKPRAISRKKLKIRRK